MKLRVGSGDNIRDDMVDRHNGFGYIYDEWSIE